MTSPYARIKRPLVPPSPLVSFAGRPCVFLWLPDDHQESFHRFRPRLECPGRSGALAAGSRNAGDWRGLGIRSRSGKPPVASVRQNAHVHGCRTNHFEPLAHPVSTAGDELQRARDRARLVFCGSTCPPHSPMKSSRRHCILNASRTVAGGLKTPTRGKPWKAFSRREFIS